LQIPNIMSLRNKLIYGRKTNNIKKVNFGSKFLSVLQEVAMTDSSVATEFKLKRPVRKHDEKESRVPLISNAGEVESVRLGENTKVKKKVDYLVNDVDVKSMNALLELEKAGIGNSNLVKLLSAGLLGLKKNRKLVPTRWSITAVDDGLSKEKLKRIKYFSVISEIEVFHSEYLGNHYEFLLLPEEFSFEVIELSMKTFGIWHDRESFFSRKKYADSVTGAYYANRLALTEYLDRIKRQAKCIVFREVRPEYYAPLGVGILREISREAFKGKGEKFNSVEEALTRINSRLRVGIKYFRNKSIILKSFGVQRKIGEWF